MHLKDIKLCKQPSAVPRGNVSVITSRTAVIKKKKVFHFKCFTIFIVTEMLNTFPINVSVLDKTSKDPLKELTAKSFKVSQTFFFFTAKTNYNLREVLPSTRWVIMGWQPNKSSIPTGISLDLCTTTQNKVQRWLKYKSWYQSDNAVFASGNPNN